MDRFRILRIVLMITAIFAAGIGVGYRFLPPPATPALKVVTGAGREVSADTIVAFYDKELHLDDAQKKALHSLAQPFLAELTNTQPGTKQRIAVFRAYFPKVRALLREDQHAAFDALTKNFRERVKQIGS